MLLIITYFNVYFQYNLKNISFLVIISKSEKMGNIMKNKQKYLFNIACADGDFEYIKNNIKNFSRKEIEFGFRLAANHDQLKIVKYFFEFDFLEETFDNCSTPEDNAFMSSLTLNNKPNKVTLYLLEERNYQPPESVLWWIKENKINYKYKN